MRRRMHLPVTVRAPRPRQAPSATPPSPPRARPSAAPPGLKGLAPGALDQLAAERVRAVCDHARELLLYGGELDAEQHGAGEGGGEAPRERPHSPTRTDSPRPSPRRPTRVHGTSLVSVVQRREVIVSPRVAAQIKRYFVVGASGGVRRGGDQAMADNGWALEGE